MSTLRNTVVGGSLGDSNRRLWLAYAGVCLMTWLLFVLASTESQRAEWQVWSAVYEATMTLKAPMLLGCLVFPWTQWLQQRGFNVWGVLALHLLAALLFSAAWLAMDYLAAQALFGPDHAEALLAQTLLRRLIWGASVYVPLVTGFNAVLNARQARRSALAAAQAESALARAELAVVSGKLNPHFLFNTLNSLIALTRKDAKAAERGLLRFANMLRYVLDSKRQATDRVSLHEELDFVRDYLDLEALRLGPRLKVEWALDPNTLDDAVPPLTLQPLVENSIVHAIAPRTEGGLLHISAKRDALTQGLMLSIRDDGPGCDPKQLEDSRQQGRQGIGLGALRQRFALDYEGRARLTVSTALGAGFRVDIWIPPA